MRAKAFVHCCMPSAYNSTWHMEGPQYIFEVLFLRLFPGAGKDNHLCRVLVHRALLSLGYSSCVKGNRELCPVFLVEMGRGSDHLFASVVPLLFSGRLRHIFNTVTCFLFPSLSHQPAPFAIPISVFFFISLCFRVKIFVFSLDSVLEGSPQ